MKILKNIKTRIALLLIIASSIALSAQDLKVVEVKTDIFTVTYSEIFQQPLKLSYKVECTGGDASRLGMSFKKHPGVITSDDEDYINNVWDKGHLAPAADFNCNEDMVRSTFTYLNCALQHESLNRGPWKELERFERDLAKIYTFVSVVVTLHFEDKPENWLKTGALVPVGFTKTIWCDGERFDFYFPNKDVAGHDWIEYKTN